MGVSKPISSNISPVFQIYLHITSLNVMFIFDRYHCSWAAVTPVKYESDSKDLTDTSQKYLKSLTQEINEQSFSNPKPCSNHNYDD